MNPIFNAGHFQAYVLGDFHRQNLEYLFVMSMLDIRYFKLVSISAPWLERTF